MLKINQYIITILLFASMPIQAANIAVTVDDIAAVKGNIQLQIWSQNDEQAWNKKELKGKIPVQVVSEPVQAKTMVITLNNIPDGIYAIRIYHDANKNNKMDTNFLGIPKEGYGFSNNATGTMGPPDFQAAAFQVKGNTEVNITLN